MKTYPILLSIFLFGCGGGSSDLSLDQAQDFSVGVIRSGDLTYIDVDSNFNSWLISGRGGVIREIELEVNEIPGVFVEPVLWALIVRTDTDPFPLGVVDANLLDIRLFSNYAADCCLNAQDPIGKFETADKSYVAVDGYINYESTSKATFSLNFQQESSVRSGDPSGQIVNIEGCWNIAGEGAPSGCEI